MRTIKFRGKTENGNWVFGQLCSYGNNYAEIEDGTFNKLNVLPKTIGEFTGLFDVHNREIYEDDKLLIKVRNFAFTAIVEYNEKEALFELVECGAELVHRVPLFKYVAHSSIEIIGNIHDASPF